MTGLHLPHLKSEIVRPALRLMGGSDPARYASDAAVNLVTGTALAESQAVFLRQRPRTVGGPFGPAMGLWQMEPATLDDLWYRWMQAPAQADLRRAISNAISPQRNPVALLVSDLWFAAMLCRCRYIPAAPAIPTDARGLAGYHETFYNRGGAADAVRNTPLFQQAIAA